MRVFMEKITLENVFDKGLADHGYIKDTEVRTLKVKAMPDTGAWTLVINEEVREKLGLDPVQQTLVGTNGEEAMYVIY